MFHNKRLQKYVTFLLKQQRLSLNQQPRFAHVCLAGKVAAGDFAVYV